MSGKKKLSASLEDYLEAIYNIVKKNKVARSKDISKELGITNSSVSGALQALSKRNLINYIPYEVITLTQSGIEVAEKIVKKHKVLMDFFVNALDLNKSEAEDVACKMEHSLTPNLLKKLSLFVEFVQISKIKNKPWILDLKEKLQNES